METTAMPSDDGFHDPQTNDPYWTETAWFAFFVPERKLSGTLYPLFRRNLGLCSSGVHIWDDTGSAPHEILYDRMLWHLPFPDGDLTDVELASGLRYRCTVPATRFELSYHHDGAVELDLTFDGLFEPHYLGPAHLDQPGHVRGRLVLHGDEIDVDCLALRDRTWSPRSDLQAGLGSRSASGGYSYASADGATSFQAISSHVDGRDVVVAGYLAQDGKVSDLVGGIRRVLARHDGHPTAVTLELEDRLGRTVHAEGRCHNAFAWAFTPTMFSWNCLTEWTWDGATAWGEDHDNWNTQAWHAFRRAGCPIER
jgi:hypothetical protein